MTIVNTETGEITETMSADDARRLTERIRIAATNYTDAKAKVLQLVDEAKAGAAHVALGYASWTAYLSDVLSDEPLRLARDERRELVTRLADEGMSTRAIAPIVGVSKSQVASDLEPTVQNWTVETPRKTEGLDGRARSARPIHCRVERLARRAATDPIPAPVRWALVGRQLPNSPLRKKRKSA